jgi:hypothetical protein
MTDADQIADQEVIKNGFQLDEAYKLIDQLVLRKNTLTKAELNVGRVVGLLTLNEQIEVVVKFLNEIKQFTKPEFDVALELLDD